MCSVVQLASCGRDLCALGTALLHLSIPGPENSWLTLCLYEFAKPGTSCKCSHMIFDLLCLLILFSVMFSKLLHHRLHQIFTCSNVWIISHCMFMPLYVCVWVCMYAIVHVYCAEDWTYSLLQKLCHWAYTQSCLCHTVLIQFLFVVTWIAPTSGYCETH